MATKDGMTVESPQRRPWDRHPYRIGVLNDFPGTAGDLADDWVRAMELCFDEAYERRRIARPVEIFRRDVYAHPWNSGHPMVAAYRSLVVDDEVLGVIGPMKTGDNLAITAEVARLGVPQVAMCGTRLHFGPQVFNLQQGSLMDEPPVVCDWLVAKGLRACAVVAENDQIGLEYLAGFVDQMRTRDLEMVALSTAIEVMDSVEHIAAEFTRLKRSEADCLVYWALGMNNDKVNPALERAGWDPLRVMSSAFVTASMSEQWARRLDGWYGVDQFDEDNPQYQDLLDRYEARYSRRPNNSMFPCGYDMANVVVEGLARMRYVMPAALVDGMEQVRLLPAAAGLAGTRISLAPYEHRGYAGCYLVMRRSVGGRTVKDVVQVR